MIAMSIDLIGSDCALKPSLKLRLLAEILAPGWLRVMREKICSSWLLQSYWEFGGIKDLKKCGNQFSLSRRPVQVLQWDDPPGCNLGIVEKEALKLTQSNQKAQKKDLHGVGHSVARLLLLLDQKSNTNGAPNWMLWAQSPDRAKIPKSAKIGLVSFGNEKWCTTRGTVVGHFIAKPGQIPNPIAQGWSILSLVSAIWHASSKVTKGAKKSPDSKGPI